MPNRQHSRNSRIGELTSKGLKDRTANYLRAIERFDLDPILPQLSVRFTAEVGRRDKLVREMVAGGMLGRPDVPANGREATADLTARLDHMAGEAAQREADLVAARWRIAQLERERAQAR